MGLSEKEKYSLKVYGIASVLIILGLIALVIEGNIGDEYIKWKPYLNNFSGTLLVGGLLSILFKIFQDGENNSELKRLFRIHDSIDNNGFIEIYNDVQSYNFHSLVSDSNELSIIINDGSRWIGNNSVSLVDRFSQNTSTEFFIVDPNSNFVDVLAHKVGSTPGRIKDKIQDSYDRIDDAWKSSNKKGNVKIYALKNFPTKTVFLTEDLLVETPYQISSGRVDVPVYLYSNKKNKNIIYSFVKNDIEALRVECELIYECGDFKNNNKE